MKRLVYAPKVWIFIRSSNLNGRIYDVSNDVVSGSVTQNLNDVSTAEFQLRNRFRKWIREYKTKRVIFLPMDLVTIWMQRIAGRPIQVFTGYLDETPYYQGYPGNAIFKATCTLKRLAFNWFDPGLPFFQNWIFRQQYWQLDPETGEILGLASLGMGNPDGVPQGSVGDSGLGSLLGNFLTEVAGWSPDDVLIGGLPASIAGMVAEIYRNISAKTIKDEKMISKFMQDYLSIDGWTPSPVPPPQSDDPQIQPGTGAPPRKTLHKLPSGATVSVPQILAVVDRINASATRNNIPPLVLTYAAFLLSNMNPSYQEHESSGSPNWGYGLYALRPSAAQSPQQAERNISDATDPASIITRSIDGVSIDDVFDPLTSSDLFSRRLNMNKGIWSSGAMNNDMQDMTTWIEKALGRSIPPGTWPQEQALQMAKEATYTQMTIIPEIVPQDDINPHTADLNDTSVQKLISPQEAQVLNNEYAQSDPIISKIIIQAKSTSPDLRVAALPDMSPWEVFFTGPPSEIATFYNSLIGDTTNLYVETNVTGTIKTLRQGVSSGLPARDKFSTVGILVAVDKTTVHPDAPIGNDGGSGRTGIAGQASKLGADYRSSLSISLPQIGVFAANAAFAANFAFPTNIPEAFSLTGSKALMNDTSCLDAVKQFCQASLRVFRSLPDGRFCAFYPDYFGAGRGPYWNIYNIEMIDFGIQLNDKALATHVYVVGNTFDPTDANSWQNEVASRGVATINTAAVLGFINGDLGGGKLDPQAFIRHYGERPHKENEPIIRSPIYEFLLAWQRFQFLWSQMFATNIQFTFQPEVMAGGIIAFPEHNVQMFVESVTHGWDYATGFTTQANLSAPSLMKKVPTNQMPGFVLSMDALNLVGENQSLSAPDTIGLRGRRGEA